MSQATTITRKVAAGLYEVEHCPADSNVFTSFQLCNEGQGIWRITNEGAYVLVLRSKAQAIAAIKSITRAGSPNLFQD